jgi:hypothetical protein
MIRGVVFIRHGTFLSITIKTSDIFSYSSYSDINTKKKHELSILTIFFLQMLTLVKKLLDTLKRDYPPNIICPED